MAYISAPLDTALSREDLHDFLCAGHLSGLLLPGQPDPGCRGYGLRGAESSDHRGGLAEGEGVSDGHGAPSERTKSMCRERSCQRYHAASSNIFLFEVGSKKTGPGGRRYAVTRVVSILSEDG